MNNYSNHERIIDDYFGDIFDKTNDKLLSMLQSDDFPQNDRNAAATRLWHEGYFASDWPAEWVEAQYDVIIVKQSSI